MDLDPNYPVVSGWYDLTEDWAMRLPWPLSRRIEDESLVLWCPGVTIWVDTWSDEEDGSLVERLDDARKDLTRGAFDIRKHCDRNMARLIYRLPNDSALETDHALYAKVLGDESELFISVSFNPSFGLETVVGMLESVRLRD